MSKCMFCSKEVKSEGTKPKKYCNDKCRKAYSRMRMCKEQTDKRTEQTETDACKRTGLPRPKDVGITFDDKGDVHVPDGVFTRLMAQAKPGHVRVSKPGDADYKPLCQYTRDWCVSRGLPTI